MTKRSDDSPYAEGPSRAPRAHAKPAAKAPAKAAAKAPAKPAAKPAHKPAAKRPAKAAAHEVKHETKHEAKPAARSRSRRRGRGKGGGGGEAKHGAMHAHAHSHRSLTSHPTSRGAQNDTRAWLLAHYGPHCAYCGLKFSARVMTLDHVAPRRGLTAYDRRDNLVLACRPCNEKKRDQSPLAFLLAVKSRAVNLVKYGAHLSAGLLDLARPLVREAEPGPAERPAERVRWGADDDDGPSPYRD